MNLYLIEYSLRIDGVVLNQAYLVQGLAETTRSDHKRLRFDGFCRKR